MKPGNRLLWYGAKSCRTKDFQEINQLFTPAFFVLYFVVKTRQYLQYYHALQHYWRPLGSTSSTRRVTSCLAQKLRSIMSYLFLDSPLFLEDERGQ